MDAVIKGCSRNPLPRRPPQGAEMRTTLACCLLWLLTLASAARVFSLEIPRSGNHLFEGTSNYSARTNDEVIQNVVRKVDAVLLGMSMPMPKEATGVVPAHM